MVHMILMADAYLKASKQILLADRLETVCRQATISSLYGKMAVCMGMPNKLQKALSQKRLTIPK